MTPVACAQPPQGLLPPLKTTSIHFVNMFSAFKKQNPASSSIYLGAKWKISAVPSLVQACLTSRGARHAPGDVRTCTECATGLTFKKHS